MTVTGHEGMKRVAGAKIPLSYGAEPTLTRRRFSKIIQVTRGGGDVSVAPNHYAYVCTG